MASKCMIHKALLGLPAHPHPGSLHRDPQGEGPVSQEKGDGDWSPTLPPLLAMAMEGVIASLRNQEATWRETLPHPARPVYCLVQEKQKGDCKGASGLRQKSKKRGCHCSCLPPAPSCRLSVSVPSKGFGAALVAGGRGWQSQPVRGRLCTHGKGLLSSGWGVGQIALFREVRTAIHGTLSFPT